MRLILVAILLATVVGCGPTKTEKAEEQFEKGNRLFKKGDYDKAIACFTKAIRLNPDFAYA